MIEATVVCDSVSPQEKRITTFKLRYPKFIHGEFMTHRVISRNASSSRAVPVSRLIQEVRNDALRATFVWWGKEQKGMQALEELDDLRAIGVDRAREIIGEWEAWMGDALKDPSSFSERAVVQELWKEAALDAASLAEMMHRTGAHKQLVNRVLEPYSHINVVATATEWDNFFGLRLHRDAQPEMRALAAAMWEARKTSEPRTLVPAQWHLPFVSEDDLHECRLRTGYGLGYRSTVIDTNKTDTHAAWITAVSVSVARCARVSYESFETGKRSTIDEDLKLYDRLVGSQPLHASPAEHQATPDEDCHTMDLSWDKNVFVSRRRHEWGNFVGWRQFRKMLPNEAVAPLPEEYR